LLVPTGIAAKNIDSNTIYSVLSIYYKRSIYYTSFFQFNNKKEILKSKKILIIDKISIVDTVILDYFFSLFAKLRNDPQLFKKIYIIAFGDLIQLSPVQGQKVFKASV
jgi:hypothetical protein